MKIDFTSGQIEVDLEGGIDADVPPRHFLYYTVIASDKCTEGNPADCPPDKNYFNTEGNVRTILGKPLQLSMIFLI